MDAAIISALSAVMGSIVGGSTSFATAWINQRHQSRREMLIAHIERKEMLYGEFIDECSKLAIDAMDHSMDEPEKLFRVYALQNRIRLMSSEAVVFATDATVRNILYQYQSPNISLGEFSTMVMMKNTGSEPPSDPLKQFSEACRFELATLRRSGLTHPPSGTR